MGRTGRPPEHEEEREAFTLRLTRTRHRQLKVCAAKTDTTMSGVVNDILDKWWESLTPAEKAKYSDEEEAKKPAAKKK